MEMNAFIHRQHGGGPESFRSSAAGVASYPSSNSLPGLRAHLPSLPMRLAALHPPSSEGSSTSSSSSVNTAASSSSGSSSASSSMQSSGPQQVSSLAPLRFIIPSSHCPPPSSFSGGASHNNGNNESSHTVSIRPAVDPSIMSSIDVSRAFGNPSLLEQQRKLLRHQQHQNRPPPIEIAPSLASTLLDLENAASIADANSSFENKNRKSPAKRNRTVKNPNRSTKSKARPGLRKGKWTEEEERYATQLTNYFKEGLLPIERGTMLRLYLSQKLNCEPMRITKKFTGGECIGKQVFRPCSPTPESRIRLMQAQLELVALEAAFIKKLKENKEEVPGLTDEGESTLPPGAIAVSARPKKRRPNKNKHDDDEGMDDEETREASGFTSDSSTSSETTPSQSRGEKKDNVDDANAVGLLLDFFYKASKKEDESEDSKADSGVKGEASSEPEPEPELEDEAPMPMKKPELTVSPTKRMRTLSISQCHTDVTSPKRSRVGSFTVVTSHP